jgi:hypothetical protein
MEDIILALAHKVWGNNETPQSGWYSSLNANWAPPEYKTTSLVKWCVALISRSE